ncbi:pancreatic secretory granule membrane major glycoprotein GP2-like [Orbicella faveolata]|uniref:pancreatic secretory granule membrane major glycoprotein GP2-like n=1 Tax=Orbicella faveolata TaxID=48498 RepID=UPI0009E1E886|nr:pancreatic secretory granule membrane major glycoprotein GP2-like [Orbicella faveolata]
MPTTCPPVRRCGTHAPGWIKGLHPSVADGQVTREVCYHWSNNCCRWKNNIKVKNCGAFYVYELQKTPACSLRYCVASNDPCSNYKSLNAADRLESYTGQSPVRCDQRDITPGWYRFTGVAGNPKMPTTCPPVRRCGTHAPGWIKGQHPSVADGEVTREICYHWSNNCCRWKNNIKVKNCGAFYVYELQKTPACSLRYCVASNSNNPCSNYKILSAADRLESFTGQSPVRCDQ